jgi:hypothetical protein
MDSNRRHELEEEEEEEGPGKSTCSNEENESFSPSTSDTSTNDTMSQIQQLFAVSQPVTSQTPLFPTAVPPLHTSPAQDPFQQQLLLFQIQQSLQAVGSPNNPLLALAANLSSAQMGVAPSGTPNVSMPAVPASDTGAANMLSNSASTTASPVFDFQRMLTQARQGSGGMPTDPSFAHAAASGIGQMLLGGSLGSLNHNSSATHQPFVVPSLSAAFPGFMGDPAAAMGHMAVPTSSASFGIGSSSEPPVKRQKRHYHHESFPEKLHRLLREVEAQDRDDIISFNAEGTAFCIHQPEAFGDEILSNYFRHSKLSSFKRQLSMYGFARILAGPDVGSFTHPLFRKGQSNLSKQMNRVS